MLPPIFLHLKASSATITSVQIIDNTISAFLLEWKADEMWISVRVQVMVREQSALLLTKDYLRMTNDCNNNKIIIIIIEVPWEHQDCFITSDAHHAQITPLWTLTTKDSARA